MISGVTIDLVNFKVVPSTWVRVIAQGDLDMPLVEQVRCVDRSRCGAKIGDLVEYDLKLVEYKLRQLFFNNGRQLLVSPDL